MNNIAATITTHPFFAAMRPEHLEHLLKNAREAEFQSGQTIFSQGEPANRFYLITSGKIALEADDRDALVQTLGPGEVLGWSWLFPPFSWHFSARAIEPTQCVVLDGAHLLVAAEENPDFGFYLMQRISQILIGRLQATRKKLLEASASKHSGIKMEKVEL